MCARDYDCAENGVEREKKSYLEFFTLCDNDDSKATCQVCNEKISRGGSKRKAYNTTNLRKHLQQHAGKYKELLEVEEREQSRKRSKEEEDKLLQPKINETLEALNLYSPASPRHVSITKAIALMIAIDFQPFSIVEDEGFKRLLRILDKRYQLPCENASFFEQKQSTYKFINYTHCTGYTQYTHWVVLHLHTEVI